MKFHYGVKNILKIYHTIKKLLYLCGMKTYSFLKDIVYVALAMIVIGGVYEYLEKNNWDYSTIITGDLFKQRPIETTSMNTYDNLGEVVYIKGLGDFNQSDLLEAESVVESYYNTHCTIDGSTNLGREFYESNSIKGHEALDYLRVSGKKTIYVTNDEMITTETNKSIKGCSRINGNTIIVRTKTLKRTLIHEYAHTLGLEHCTNGGCALSKGDSEELCSECYNKIKR